MLSNDAPKVIKHQSEEYTWNDANGLDEEMNGMTITALILWHLHPHHKVAMYSEIGAVNSLSAKSVLAGEKLVATYSISM
jgi:hypothetical protein